MGTAKDEVMRILGRLPDDASLEDIQYHLYVRQKIEHGLESALEALADANISFFVKSKAA